MSALRSPIRQQATPTLEATPLRATAQSLSGTLIPETPPGNEQATTEQKPEAPHLMRLLVLLGEAMCDINLIRTTTGHNKTCVDMVKISLEEARTIAQNLLKEEEDKKNQKMEQMAKDLNDIKRLLAKPKTYAQTVATGPPETHQDKDKTKQQRKELTITVTAATAPDTIKSQLKTMHAKDMIQKCQSAITESFKEGHVPKIHGINKLSNDD
jgi:hypothetical protein